MRVLLDEQLSESLLQHLQDLSPDAVHVRLLWPKIEEFVRGPVAALYELA